MASPDTSGAPSARQIAVAARAIAATIRRSPVLTSRSLSEISGGTVVLKAESLQRTGSFKLRGALSKIHALGADAARGVITGSAGNHAQAVAYAARARGVPCTVVMPQNAAIGKVEAAAASRAQIVMHGADVDEAIAHARHLAHRHGMVFVHPFDDPDVVAGQGTIGLELLDDIPDLERVIVPIGGGGLASGVALAVRSARPGVSVVGVQAASVPGVRAALAGITHPQRDDRPTLADGIAVKRPGGFTLAMVRTLVDEVVEVDEETIAEAIAVLMRRAKLVVEGAGAVGVAALIAGVARPAPEGTTAVVLSGGNIDPGVLGEVMRRDEIMRGRRVTVRTRVSDRPGALAALLDLVGRTGANLLEVGHHRDGAGLRVRETAVELVLEVRGPDHAGAVVGAVRAAGYPVDHPGRPAPG